MQLQHFTLCTFAAAIATTAQAAPFSPADSLKQLPASVQQQLGVGNPDDAIADRGEPFNPGCILRDAVPRKRFLMGAQSSDVVVVAVEFGGIAHHAEALAFRRDGKTWLRAQTQPLTAFPKTMPELLSLLGMVPPAPRPGITPADSALAALR
jgi:hypothetical protein